MPSARELPEIMQNPRCSPWLTYYLRPGELSERAAVGPRRFQKRSREFEALAKCFARRLFIVSPKLFGTRPRSLAFWARLLDLIFIENFLDERTRDDRPLALPSKTIAEDSDVT